MLYSSLKSISCVATIGCNDGTATPTHRKDQSPQFLIVDSIPSICQCPGHLCWVAGWVCLASHSPAKVLPKVLHWIEVWGVARPRQHNTNVVCFQEGACDPRGVRGSVVLLEHASLGWQCVEKR